ncbi:response regulator [Paenibacillus sp. HWE-109]|uniref:response regulator n=1 Tax=Paenibacillus sp. HWE-109 TaxID=1306526 RepID=UPI001EDCCC8F|nr:response regulator [Paenibacillus sp. HWE-109]UKS28510.1 response regulator [Paenibacillus sp. HWE-109]
MKLMVVDDEPIILNGIIRMIQKADTPFTEIVGAADGIDAIQKLAHFQPDLILTDIHMPELDGLALIKHIQEMNLCSRFVILTGYSDFAYARQALRYQVIDYLLKPINKDELITILHKIGRTIQQEQARTIEHDLLLLKEHILYNTPYEELSLRPEQLQPLFPHPYTTIIVFQACENEPPLPAERLDGIVNALAAASSRIYKTQSRFLRQTILIVNGAHVLSDAELHRLCGEFKIQGSGYCIGASGGMDDGISLRNLYIEAMASLLFQRYFGSCGLTVFKQETENLYSSYDSLVHYIEQSLLHQTSIEQIEKDMQPILLYFSGDIDCHSKLREQFLVCIGLYLQNVNLTPEAIWGEQAAAQLFSSSGAILEDVRVAEILVQLIRYMRRSDNQQPNVHAIDKIVAFVEQNYKLDLSLDAVADHVQMHPNYISMLFRKEMGLTFLHYLHTYRLAKAKLIMQENPEWPINTIAELVGYENPRHFFKVFKKFENITPGQFRIENSS